MQVSGIILAGGKSNRMGRNKALLKIGGLTLIERVARVLSAVCPEIVIAGGSAADFGHLGYPVVPDVYPGYGPLSGIHAGLSAIQNDYGFVSACDIPFINENLISRIISRADGHDAIIVKHEDYFEPLFSLYSKNFARAAEKCINNRVYKVTAALSLVKWCGFSVDASEIPNLEKSLTNINTPGEYEEAKKIKD